VLSLASQELEHALVIDTKRDAVRMKLAEILDQRAQLADDSHHVERREELLRRLALYDTGGALVSAWSAPATLVLDVTPPTATIEIATLEHGGSRPVARRP